MSNITSPILLAETAGTEEEMFLGMELTVERCIAHRIVEQLEQGGNPPKGVSVWFLTNPEAIWLKDLLEKSVQGDVEVRRYHLNARVNYAELIRYLAVRKTPVKLGQRRPLAGDCIEILDPGADLVLGNGHAIFCVDVLVKKGTPLLPAEKRVHNADGNPVMWEIPYSLSELLSVRVENIDSPTTDTQPEVVGASSVEEALQAARPRVDKN